MTEGIILKGYSGFYYVLAGETVYDCALRGRHKLTKETFLPGDRVRISTDGSDRASIEEVFPRRNRLIRPPVANVSLIVVVLSQSNPKPDLPLLDRILVLAEEEQIRPLIVWNKVDVGDPRKAADLEAGYRNTGYRFLKTSAQTGEGLEELRKELLGETTVFAGQSGVGKTSIMNRFLPEVDLKTGSVGEKGRGRHTTRHIELFPFAGGYLADTPGFNRLYLPGIDPARLQYCFPEFSPHLEDCRFSSCLHRREPDCRVKEAVEEGLVGRRRYENYLYLLQELEEKEKTYR